MKANPDKYYLLINNTKEGFQIKISNETVSNSKYEKLLGVKVDHELNFNEHLSSLCNKTSQKLNALSRTFIIEIWKNLWLKSSKLITWAHEWCFWVSRKTILPTNNFAFQVEEDPYNKIWHKILPLPQIMEPCFKWIENYWITWSF